MVSIPRFSTLPPEWNAVLAEAIVSSPISAVVSWLSSSEATVGAGMMIFGAVTTGAVAVIRSVDSSAAGLYADFLNGVLELAIFVVMTGTAAVWLLPRVVFFALAGGVVVCLASMFGLGCG